ncbi:MAG TPA: type II toxin-antitoxin system HigB family toxin, partial [Lacipirellulaceae bacterium]|nr:type II toxin-antitoxin system HigB family toxin [Lacipirellulaceae bacterium]
YAPGDKLSGIYRGPEQLAKKAVIGMESVPLVVQAPMADVQAAFPGADGFNLECGIPVVVFNVGGNKFRLVARIYYHYGRVYVKTVLTHKDYDAAKWREQICLGLI